MKKILFLCFLLAACGKDNERPASTLWEIVISEIGGVPPGTAFDRVAVEVVGADWQTIATVEAPFVDGKAVLTLPAEFAQADLQQVDRGERASEMWGYWPSTATARAARVATLRDEFIVWSGTRRVGRVYLTDWSGDPTTTTLGKMYVGWQYADRPFELNGFTGKNYAFTFSGAVFARGWNRFARINVTDELIRVTTSIPAGAIPGWRFEAWP